MAIPHLDVGIQLGVDGLEELMVLIPEVVISLLLEDVADLRVLPQPAALLVVDVGVLVVLRDITVHTNRRSV